MKHISNQEKATEIAAERKRLYFDSDGLIINSEVECYAAAEEMAQWKDEQFAQEKKEIDEQWKRLMAESKSIGVDLLQRKEEQMIDKACEAFCKCECCGDCGEHKTNCIILGEFKQAMKG
ncbi:MAG: hypothetical protein J6T22_09330 [Bacteroidales bacterium]|nr:hypothetical protein [Bacteroidales bacterium]MBO7617395.1 hypothetical protein [Bacteroidales bacterium]